MLKVESDPAGHAPNMAWVVRNESGEVLHRGPEWTCWLYVSERESYERRRAWNQS